MKHLKKLGTVVCLTLVFALPAFADCSVDPGIQSTPPCATAQNVPDEPAPTDQTVTAIPSTGEIELAVTEVAMQIAANFLTVF
jgi:hypothetical protein